MSDLLKRLAELSPEKRRLLELRLQMARTEAAGPTIRPREGTGNTFPLSFAQQRLWLVDELEPGTGSYNIPLPMRLRGALDAAALERAIDALRERHESLRTTFSAAADGGDPVQVVHPFAPAALPVEDLSALPAEERERVAAERVAADANTGFDLRAGPVVRARLLRLGAEDHVLLLNMHHIVGDGWSMGVLWRELGELYSAFSAGRPSPLPPLPVQYADFALWQREYLKGELLEKHLAYWRDKLEGAPPVLELPTDRPRPAVESHRGDTFGFALSAPLAERVRELAREEGTTPFVVLLAALKTVLGRHAGQRDVVVGTPIANRTRAQIEGLIGFFVNSLALRTDLSGDPSFRELLRRVKETTLGAFSHQDLPFERLVEELKTERDLSRNPVFQVMFALQNADMGGLDLPGLRIEPYSTEYTSSKFDLTLTLQELAEGGMAGGAEYATDLFDAETVSALVEHFTLFLERASSAPDLPLSAVPMTGEAEVEQLVRGWNATTTAYPRERTLASLFEEQAAATPEAPALSFGETSLTYAELNASANRLARHLRAAGVGPESRVGLSMERSAELVVSFLAIVKAGGAYVPLDPSYPADRLAFMLEDSGISVLVVRDELPSALAGFGGTVVSLDRDAARIGGRRADDAAAAENLEDAGADPDSLAYVVYTSGSTGRPKGIGIPHRAVVRLVRETNFVRVDGTDRIAQVSNASFDAITYEVWGALLNGAALVGLERDLTLSPEALVAAYRERGITGTFLTTALFNHVAREVPDGFRTLRHVLFGGEACDPLSIRRVLEGGAPERLLHVYGPTESTTFATWFRVERVEAGAATVPIGEALANTTLYVLDAAMQPVPVGVVGELFIGGDGLARGYLGRPELTAEKFVPSPFGAGERLYRTGDAVRRLRDGNIEFAGRLDEQVKIRGFRIELGEVEAALAALPGVREAAVVVREETPGDKRLVAYVAAGGEGEPATAASLRVPLQQALPEYMVPSAIVVLERLPITPNGKVDRKALPAPEADDFTAGEEFVAPRTPLEEVLAGIWAEVLRLDRVSAAANFFELGGHSLLATQVVSRIRQLLSAEIPLRALFEASTVRDLAARVEAAREAGDVAPPITPAERDGGPLPLSFAQERMWFIDQLEPGNHVYNMPLPVDLEGELDTSALEWALGETVRRHEALRATFADVDGSPVQTLAPPCVFHLPVVPLDAMPEALREGEVDRLALEDALAPFDLARGPLFRARLLRVRADKHVLLLNMHHIVSDGWSLGILFREVSELYAARLRGQESPLAELPVQYADFAVWQRRHLSGERLGRQIRYWRERLAGIPSVLELPTDRPRPANQSFRGDAHDFVLDAELVGRLRELGRREGATLFMTMLAAWQVLLSRYARQGDVVVGSPIAGRNRAETEGLVGFFVNTLALRGDLSDDPSFRQAVARARETTLGAYQHQDLPFEKLVEELNVERSMAYAPIFQVMFALQNIPLSGLELEGTRMAPRGVERGSSKFDLTLDMSERPDGSVAASFEYATDLWDSSSMQRMARHLETLLRGLAEAPDAPVSTVNLLPEDEERLVVRGFNDWTRREHYRRDVLMHEWFEAQATRTPDAPAVAHEDGGLSYRELNERANRLARYLRGRGVGPDVRVGVLMERTPELIVALYAVLKAGGAYVPLDPAYPADRVAFMLEDTAVPVLLTQERLVAKLPETQAEVFAVDADWARVSAESAENLPRVASPENLGYLIYTSGSTGRPKGVQLEHRSAAIVLQWMRDEFPDELRGAVLASTSVCFDVSIAEIFGTLSWGGKIVLVRNALSLANLPAGHEVLMASMVPSAAAELYRMDGIPKTLRSLNLGGEPVTPALSAALYSLGHVEQVVNLYGPSEDTTYTTSLWIPRTTQRMTVGRPVANTQIYVLDRHFRPTPVGVPGEVYIGGHGVTRGYHARPAMTAEKYVPDPFSDEPGGRMYRTGDLARYLPDGEIDYLGRLDHQVKIRGHRVEIGEIEAVLASHPQLAESAVLVREDVPGMPRLVAYYEAELPAPTVSALRQHVRDKLPEYMVPSAWVRMEALPHTPNGKVDKRALPAPDAPESERGYQAPRTPSEQVLASIWAEVLKTERVGVRDSFFELGGHSLLATQVMSRVREAMQVELPLRTLFDASTVEALAERVDAARREARGLPEAPLLPVARTQEIPLSFAQERLWFIDRMQPGTAVYNMPMVIRLSGALDHDAMRRALEGVVRRHEGLRTVFGRGAHGPVQVIRPLEESGFRVEIVDLRHLPSDRRYVEEKRLQDEEGVRPFDLSAGPLLRTTLVQTADEEHILLLNMHHVISDGWSLGVFFREMAALYRDFAAGEEPSLPPLSIQYPDFSAWQRDWLSGEVLERQLGYWRGKLEGAATLDLPTDRPRPAVQSYRGAHHNFTLSHELSADLHALCRREGVTLFMVLLAAYKVLLWRYAGQEDVVVGSPIAGRNRAELEEIIGFFVNTLALRTDLSGDPEFAELLRRVRETTLDAYAHQDLPFEKLVEEMKVERSLSRHPVFQASFSLQNADMGAPDFNGLEMLLTEGQTGTTKFDLTLGLTEVSGQVMGVFEYATDLFEPATVERLADHFRVLLEGIASGPRRRLSELPRLLDDGERHRVLVEWNRTGAETPRLPAHVLFQEAARRWPDAPAVVHGEETVTFAELNARANRIARHLVRRGVGPEARVGLNLDRTPETVAAILGVMKAGGAYVPLDPAYPADRLAYMQEDSGVRLLVTRRSLAGTLPPADVHEVVLDEPGVAAAIAAESGDDPGVAVDAESLAYVIYTSGSTGRPKGVLVPHRAIGNLAAAQRRIFDLSPESRVLQFASFSFDATVSEVFSTLLAGAALVMAPRAELMPGGALERTLRERGVTVATLPPSVLAMLREDQFPALRTVISAGESCSAELFARWAAGRRFVNAYGPTETTVGAAMAACEADGRRPPIGRPFENMRAYVLDEEMQPVPVGVPGELYVGGIGLARGYHGQAGLSAERFVPDPFGAEPGARLYRTGDRVRFRRGGEMEYLGRMDEQVKIRGFRIEPGEIEALLTSRAGVREATVIVREDVPGSPRLVAYVLRGEGCPTASELRAALKERLPDYMVPSAFVIMDEFPLSPNGKVDRRALPAPDEGGAGEGYVAPQGELERTIAGVWQELLHLKSVGVNDNFFEIGGHSLLLAQMHERLREVLGRDISMVDLFQYPTVAALAEHLDGSASGAAAEKDAAAGQQGKDRGSARRQMLSRRPPRR